MLSSTSVPEIDPAPDFQPPAHIFSPLAHAGQAEVPGWLQLDGLLVEAFLSSRILIRVEFSGIVQTSSISQTAK